MNKRELTREEIIGLIAEFRSEVKKNTAKIEFFNEKIEELTLLLKDAKSAPKNEIRRQRLRLLHHQSGRQKIK